MQKETIKVDIVSDIACPWCFIGKRRLETAIKQWKGALVEINWHPFQLDPTVPKAGLDRKTYLTNKFGTSDLTEAKNRIVEAGIAEGINFNLKEDKLVVNTLPMHQLMHVAGDEGFKATLKERFLKAYFEEDVLLNDTEVLVKIMTEYGWDAEKTKQIIADDAIAYAVKQEIAHYQQRGVTGVPFFIINDKIGINGAQPPNVFLDAFAQASPIEIISNGDSCDPITGECS